MPNINGGVLDGVRRIGSKVRDLIIDGGLPGAPLGYRLRGATQYGPPANGSWRAGDHVEDRAGNVWVCTAAGTPGSWVASLLWAPPPSGDATGATDLANVQAGLGLLPNGGTLRLRAGAVPYWLKAPLVYRNGQSISGDGYAKSGNAAILRQAAGASMVAPGTPALNGRGVWVSGTAYNVNDAVLIPITPGFAFFASATDRGNFAASTAYVVNNVVFNPTGDNLAYICIAAYTSTATTPDNDATHWQQVATNLYRCTVALTSATTPDADAGHWSLVMPTGLLIPYEWLNNQAFDGAPALIENVQLDGNRTANPYSACCGVIVQNFWTSVQQCHLVNMPGDGARYTDTTSNGTTISNSSSENRFMNNKVFNCTTDGLRIYNTGTVANLDGFCEDNNISACLTPINMDRAAGWLIRGNHVYGVQGNAISASNSFATRILDNYVEQFGSGNASGYYYAGIGITQLNGRASHIRGNFIGSNDPSVNSSHYQLLAPTAGSGQTAYVICTDNAIVGPAVPAGSQGLVLQINPGGTLTIVADKNQIVSVATELFVAAGVTVVGKNHGSYQLVGYVQPGNNSTPGGHVYSGSGAPNITGSVAGDLYLRIDTPSTANQRLYIATAANTWTALIV